MKLSATWAYISCLLLGAAAFWVPDALAHAGRLSAPADVIVFTLLGPACALGTYQWLRRRFPLLPTAVPLWMLLGIWILGPLGIAIGLIPLGGTFLSPDRIGGFLWIWLLFPMTTFVMSTYSGSLGGVILVTLLLLVVAALGRRRVAASNNRWRGP